LWLKTHWWKKMKICLKMQAIWKRQNSKWRFLMLDDFRWVAYLFRFCTQILYMTFLYKTHEDFFMLNDLKWATYLFKFCTQILYMELLYKSPTLYILSRLQFFPCLFFNA
jgi:hypothetical protein